MKNTSIGARETIARRNKTRTEIKQVQEELRDMQQLYEKERSKKRVRRTISILQRNSFFFCANRVSILNRSWRFEGILSSSIRPSLKL